MRRIAAFLSIIWLLLGAFCPLDGQEGKQPDEDLAREIFARDVLMKALQAHGGKEKCALLEKCIVVSKGKMAGQPFTAEQWMELPERSKTLLVFEKDEKTGKVEGSVQIVNGEDGWALRPAGFVRASKADLQVACERRHRDYLRLLYPILEQPQRFKAEYLGETFANGRSAEGICIKTQGETDVYLYFDKETRLLIKLSQDQSDLKLGKTATHYFNDYREFKGAKYPAKTEVWADEKVAVQHEVVELRPVKAFPKGTFSKP